MNADYELEKRRWVISGVAVGVVVLYLLRLLTLQIISDDYKLSADSNALLKKVEYPARGIISDRNGKPMVYNQNSYDLMIITNEAKNRLDTLDFCRTLGITRKDFEKRMSEIKDTQKNPAYSRYTQQLFMGQLSEKEFSILQEKLYRFPGFYLQHRSLRQYSSPYAAHVLGDVGEVSGSDIEADDYYQAGDYIGKMGVERSYERVLRGEKGVQIMLRDARGRVQGSYRNHELDRKPVAGRNIKLTLDMELQALGERLMQGKRGAIVAIEPATGEVLCMVSAPTYDPREVVGRNRGEVHSRLYRDPNKPLLNRSIMGQYPPGSTFKPSQGLTFMTEGTSSSVTAYACNGGFMYKGLKVGCHAHESPLTVVPSLSTSCNGWFCWGLYHMLSNRSKYKNAHEALNVWRDYMVSMGFGYKLGIDLPGEKRGMIPNAEFYDDIYRGHWGPLSLVSISIGQGEVALTPLQIANQAATIANRGWFYTPHVVKAIQGEPLDSAFSVRHRSKASQGAYNIVVQGMRASVLNGTCKAMATLPFEACGKTGTAQNRGHDHSVFMGFAPRARPQIAVAVYVENGGFGATFGVPIGSLIMEQYINGKLSEASQARAIDIQGRHIFYGTTD